MIFNENLPIYIQIMDLVKSQISSGELKSGDKLPSVRDFSKDLKVNPNTIQRTYQELERENIVYTQRGMGTFITNDIELLKKLRMDKVSKLINVFIQEMNKIGYNNNEIYKIIEEFLFKEVVGNEDGRN